MRIDVKMELAQERRKKVTGCETLVVDVALFDIPCRWDINRDDRFLRSLERFDDFGKGRPWLAGEGEAKDGVQYDVCFFESGGEGIGLDLRDVQGEELVFEGLRDSFPDAAH